MQSEQIDPKWQNPSIIRLVDEGYEVEIVHNHLLIHSVPYLDRDRGIRKGVLVCPLVGGGDNAVPPDHVMSFQGELPYISTGEPFHNLINNSQSVTLFDQFIVNHRLSNKPAGLMRFENYYDKVVHYCTQLVSHARVIDPNADARTGITHPQRDVNSVFLYPESASSRVGIEAVSQRLSGRKVGIIGLGGTGSYILDMVAKTHVEEIHLFDGDIFSDHNSFRSPGAASLDELRLKQLKVDYFDCVYSKMRKGIIPHGYDLNDENLDELSVLDFVFIAIDDGPSRKLITAYLQSVEKPFIDVGIGLALCENGDGLPPSLRGTARVTLATHLKDDHLERHVPYAADNEDLYKSNIQVADINALNAMMAVIRWKQYEGYYSDDSQAHHLNYTIAHSSLTRCEELESI